MSRKKSYNPFNMWGSYVGAIVGFLLFPAIIYYLFSIDISKILGICMGFQQFCSNSSFILIGV